MLAAALIFSATYLVIGLERLPWLRLDRPSGALVGAAAMVVSGVIGFDQALAAIDLDTLLFLLGMMILLAYLELSGFFELVERRVLMLARGRRSLLVLTLAASGTLSALFMNDTVCLLFTPVLLRVTRRIDVQPVPYLLALAIGANCGSVATVLGNPQNAFIGVRSGIGVLRFSARLWPAALGAMVVAAAVLLVLYRRELGPGRLEVPPPREPARVQPWLLFAGALALAGMIAAMALGVRPAAAAMTAAALMILAGAREESHALARVDWPLLLFFSGLFVVMRGVSEAGLAATLVEHVGGPLDAPTAWSLARLAGAVTLLSQAVSNVPAVMLFEPAIARLPAPLGEPTFLALAAFSTLAGNLTLIGSVANVIVFERARREGVTLSFVEYLRAGLPVTILSLALAWALLAIAP